MNFTVFKYKRQIFLKNTLVFKHKIRDSYRIISNLGRLVVIANCRKIYCFKTYKKVFKTISKVFFFTKYINEKAYSSNLVNLFYLGKQFFKLLKPNKKK